MQRTRGGDDSGSPQAIPGALPAGPVTVSAEPGHAVVTVDGRTVDHTASEAGGSFNCTFSDDVIALAVTSEFGSTTLNADRVDDGWIGRFTADSDEGDADSWIQYSAQPFDGEAFSFALFGADSSTCQVAAPDSVDITINYLATENRQLQFDVRPDGDGVIGGVFVIDGTDRWSSVISTQGGTADGLSFDGSTVTYTGTFEHTSDSDPDLMEEIEGTAVVTCPS